MIERRRGNIAMSKPLFRTDETAVAQLTALAESVESGTVSRSLIAEPSFRQILFSMDAGQEISEHRSPFLAIVHVLAGRLCMQVSGQSHVLESEGWICMPPNAPHALRADQPTRFLLTMYRAPAPQPRETA